ncbi:MAG: response regulator containing a CheY-like receiver domain and a domain [Mucilaginibacter sp.]|nr:response regulator containing a CheY-like receiver domain and a domain [Mucilaginibacter sp.]
MLLYIAVLANGTLIVTGCGYVYIAPYLIMITLRKQTLLVLDDDDVFHRIVALANKPKFFKHICHFTEVDALITYLKDNRNNQFKLPDMMFVDLAIPHKDGWNFLDAYEEIRSSLSKPIKVYVVTVSVRKVDHERVSGYSFIEQFITKPISMDRFRELARYGLAA